MSKWLAGNVARVSENVDIEKENKMPGRDTAEEKLKRLRSIPLPCL